MLRDLPTVPFGPIDSMDKNLMTVAEAAARIRVGRSTMYRLIAQGAVPSIRISSRLIRIREEDLARALDAARRDGRTSIPDASDGTS
jgi:excisionase family DNA binding protein